MQHRRVKSAYVPLPQQKMDANVNEVYNANDLERLVRTDRTITCATLVDVQVLVHQRTVSINPFAPMVGICRTCLTDRHLVVP
jgi:hypothetical protein